MTQVENEPEEVDWSDMDQALDLDFDGWRPESGDKVIGTILYLSEGSSQWGPYPIIGIATDDGEGVTVHAFHSVMRNALDRFHPVPGDRIGIKYKGKRQGQNQAEPYDDYNVIVQKRAPLMLAVPEEAPALPAGKHAKEGGDGDTGGEDRGEPAGWEPAGDGSSGESSTPVVGAGTGPDEAAAPEPQGYERTGKSGAVTQAQKIALTKLLARAGEDPINWEEEGALMTQAEASDMIVKLQRGERSG